MKKLQKESLFYGAIGVAIGALLMGFSSTFAHSIQHDGMMRVVEKHTNKTQQAASDHGTMSMTEMTEQLKNKSGDDFDKAFIEMMIAHHDGAIKMAQLAASRAKHDEVKTLAKAVVSAQTSEINDMYKWQKDWGYTSDEMNQMMHGNH